MRMQPPQQIIDFHGQGGKRGTPYGYLARHPLRLELVIFSQVRYCRAQIGDCLWYQGNW